MMPKLKENIVRITKVKLNQDDVKTLCLPLQNQHTATMIQKMGFFAFVSLAQFTGMETPSLRFLPGYVV